MSGVESSESGRASKGWPIRKCPGVRVSILSMFRCEWNKWLTVGASLDLS